MAEPTKPTDGQPEWASTGIITPKPTLGEKQTGWSQFQKPPFQHFNFWQNLVFLWTTYFENKLNLSIGFRPDQVVEIVAGTFVPDRGNVAVDTEGAAATDNLDGMGLANFDSGRLIIIHSTDAARVITVRHNIGGAGKFILAGDVNAVLNDPFKVIIVQKQGLEWREVGRNFALPAVNPITVKVIAGGNVDPGTDRTIEIQPEGGVGLADDLNFIKKDTFNDGEELLCRFRMESAALGVFLFINHAIGAPPADHAQILLSDGGDLSIGNTVGVTSDIRPWIRFRYDLAANEFHEIFRSSSISHAGLMDAS